MFKAIFLLLVFCSLSFADDLRWYLEPDGQELLLDIDDLHQERITVSPEMDWGVAALDSVKFKSTISIAVMDSGIDVEHPEIRPFIKFSDDCLENNQIPIMESGDRDENGFNGDCAGWNFVENNNRVDDQDGHGTHVTGIITKVLEKFSNQVKILPLRVFSPSDANGSGGKVKPLPFRLVEAFNYAITKKVDVIHLSAGWPKSFMTRELNKVIKEAQKQGVMIVTASGNASGRSSVYPCQLTGVVCVGALRGNGKLAPFSNYGHQVDLMAPGEKILSTIPLYLPSQYISKPGYDFKNGTSQAAPFISATLAVLKGVFPLEDPSTSYARLMAGAKELQSSYALKGLFNLAKSISWNREKLFLPIVKGLHTVEVVDNKIHLEIPVRNFSHSSDSILSSSLSCRGIDAFGSNHFFNEIDAGESKILSFSLELEKNQNQLECLLEVNEKRFPLLFQVVSKLPRDGAEELVIESNMPILRTSQFGVKTRLFTVNPLPGALAEPFYFLGGAKDLVIFGNVGELSKIKDPEKCRRLRFWQVDLNSDQRKDLFIEYTCEKKYLLYRFLTMEGEVIFPAHRFVPSKALIAYSQFSLIYNAEGAPAIQFLTGGPGNPSDDPWEPSARNRENHLYRLVPTIKEGKPLYETKVIDSSESWKKDLGLRYLRGYKILQVVGEKLLVKIQRKSVWVDIESGKARWANLDHLILGSDDLQKVHESTENILQALHGPHDYRGAILGGPTLIYKNKNLRDPLFHVIATLKIDEGYQTILQSFRELIFVNYDEMGNISSENRLPSERFDFLNSQEMMASIQFQSVNGTSVLVTDGSRINNEYITVAKGSTKQSFLLPANCSTQQLVMKERKLVLPLLCKIEGRPKSAKMSFIEL